MPLCDYVVKCSFYVVSFLRNAQIIRHITQKCSYVVRNNKNFQKNSALDDFLGRYQRGGRGVGGNKKEDEPV